MADEKISQLTAKTTIVAADLFVMVDSVGATNKKITGSDQKTAILGELENLTTVEIQQLENINAVTISNAQWVFLGSFDQALATTDVVQFLRLGGGTTALANSSIYGYSNTDSLLAATFKQDLATATSDAVLIEHDGLGKVLNITAGNASNTQPAIQATQNGTGNVATLTGGGFSTSGTFGSGTAHPNPGSGTKLFFHPNKAVFRAGSVSGSQWDDVNNGDYSVAMGDSTAAGGDFSFAMGQFGNASGDLAAYFGLNNQAVAYASFVIGRFAAGAGTNGSWVATEQAFVIGNGASAGTRANCFEIFKNGNIDTIGGLKVQTLNTANGIVQTDGSGNFSTSVTLPDGTLTTTQVMADNSTKLATTAYVHAFLPVTEANGGTGETTYTDGQILIGATAGSGLTKNTISGSDNQITITNGAGTITISTPQDIATSSTPTFNGLTMTSTTQACIVPRMTTTQKTALTGIDGMIIYDTTLNKFQGFENGMWVNFA